ncbi:MAG: hypothetical protein QXL35_01045 [Candidatus Bathyarchaeia archaeon]
MARPSGEGEAKEKMNGDWKSALPAAIVAAMVVSALLVNAAFASMAQRAAPYMAGPLGGPRIGPGRMGDEWSPVPPWAADLPAEGRGLGMAGWVNALQMRKGQSAPAQWWRGRAGNVTISSAQAKAAVEAAIPSFKVGTVAPFRAGWIVPIEDGKGVVASIHVTNVAAPTAEQAKALVEESLRKGWKAGEPKLMGAIYAVPLLDYKDSIVAIVRVDGRNGEIIRRPSTIMTVTGEQAKAIANDAIREFKVGEVKDRGGSWVVRIEYRGKAVMAVVLGKLNTPTAEDALKAVQGSMARGWSAGDPKQLRSAYSVPILDANGNAIGRIRIDGRTGEVMGVPLPK